MESPYVALRSMLSGWRRDRLPGLWCVGCLVVVCTVVGWEVMWLFWTLDEFGVCGGEFVGIVCGSSGTCTSVSTAILFIVLGSLMLIVPVVRRAV